MYTEQAELTNNTFITAAMYNAFVTNILDHESRIMAQISGGGTNANVTIGMIFMWYGNPSVLTDTWHVCDGTNGTPDLRDLFILGAGDTYAVGETGGVSVHNHHVTTTGGAGGHNHSYSFTTGRTSSLVTYYLHSDTTSLCGYLHTHTSPSKSTSSVLNHTHGVPDTDNRDSLPPYKALYYIMRVK